MPVQRRKRSTISRKVKSKGPVRGKTRTLTLTRATGATGARKGRKVASRKGSLVKRIQHAMAR